jgi:hypothetical protein
LDKVVVQFQESPASKMGLDKVKILKLHRFCHQPIPHQYDNTEIPQSNMAVNNIIHTMFYQGLRKAVSQTRRHCVFHMAHCRRRAYNYICFMRIQPAVYMLLPWGLGYAHIKSRYAVSAPGRGHGATEKTPLLKRMVLANACPVPCIAL